ncbi:M1 family metallopeptidase [Streptomyces sp. LX-29]|uniref:M1 family metallopeptidase n=1 Tax=Streptomyces sp. LX-29 TaxID=2900152 RepID=UPI00240DD102|nr:M1 family metallopeptidase [Streptomyces sp. LX-29]WFB07053.1 M1 family metallopeptidase [Streptomyces sp. LX-29]
MPHTSARSVPGTRTARSARRRATRRRATLVAAALAALAAAVPSVAAGSPVGPLDGPGDGPSAPVAPMGIGDRLFPHLGNPGYDVTSYDVTFEYHGNDKPLDAVTTISAYATDTLESFNLDFTNGTVRSVEVNGRAARFATAEEDLVIAPQIMVPERGYFQVTVHHTSDPRGQGKGGWIKTSDGLVMANQANAAHRVFPCNDHPSDKARFTFRVTAPKDLTVVANGLPRGHTHDGPETTWEYRSRHPMATELAQVAIGRSTIVRRRGPGGLPVRDVVPTGERQRLAKWLAKTPGQLEWMEERVGRYPFETYGVLIADATTGFELETQTLSLFEQDLFLGSRLPAWYVESIMVHELAHQWFGNSVSPRAWSDLWLNEGHATWYEALYGDQHGEMPLDKRMKWAYGMSDAWRAQGGPPADPEPSKPGQPIGIFRPAVYDGSALILYALRQEMGKEPFERLEREWVSRNRDGVASTEDFVGLASDIAGRDLTAFLHSWLYDKKTPPMPGHADWKATATTAAKQPPTKQSPAQAAHAAHPPHSAQQTAKAPGKQARPAG